MVGIKGNLLEFPKPTVESRLNRFNPNLPFQPSGDCLMVRTRSGGNAPARASKKLAWSSVSRSRYSSRVLGYGPPIDWTASAPLLIHTPFSSHDAGMKERVRPPPDVLGSLGVGRLGLPVGLVFSAAGVGISRVCGDAGMAVGPHPTATNKRTINKTIGLNTSQLLRFTVRLLLIAPIVMANMSSANPARVHPGWRRVAMMVGSLV